MTTYATIDEFAERWPRYNGLAESEQQRAAVLLGDASVYLDSIVEKYDIDTDSKAGVLRIVCCELVARKMEVATAVPISSETFQAGSFSQTISYAPRSGRFKLLDDDWALLGISHGGACAFYPYGDD